MGRLSFLIGVKLSRRALDLPRWNLRPNFEDGPTGVGGTFTQERAYDLMTCRRD